MGPHKKDERSVTTTPRRLLGEIKSLVSLDGQRQFDRRCEAVTKTLIEHGRRNYSVIL